MFDAYVGDYALDEEPGFVFTFRRDGSRYYAGATGQSEGEIFPSSDSTFFTKTVDARVTFRRTATGDIMMTLHQGGDHDAHKVVDYTLPATKMPEYAGTYYSPELDITVTIAPLDGRLVATRNGLDSAALTAIKEDSFNGGAGYVRDVTFERGKNGKVTAMLASLGRSKGLRFEKKE